MLTCDTQKLLPVEEALDYMFKQLPLIDQAETLPIAKANNRILAQNIISPVNVPPHDNSAMDGYALSLKPDCSHYKVVGKAFAGTPFKQTIIAGECVRIMTGAVVPDGADAVIMQENTCLDGDSLRLEADCHQGDNIRLKGDDIQAGEVILKKGQLLKAAEIGLLASLGLSQVSVTTKIKVGLFTTGDELKQPGESLEQGQIYDSNRPMLMALLDLPFIEVIDLGVVNDTFDEIKQAFLNLSKQCHVVISSGGVSVGDADYTKAVIEQIGQINFWKLAIKPGKPFAFGQLGKAIFFGLPGNPVSSYVTFEQLVMPALKIMSGQLAENRKRLPLTLVGQIKKRPGRKDFQRGQLIYQNGNIVAVKSAGKQSSGVLSSVSKADCYIVLEAEDGHKSDGDMVNVELFKH
mgnify:CR=1 FL=1